MHNVGVDFYPEHWPRERWETYAKQMREAGFSIVRVAEFAWAFMEPEEGRFDFSLFDDALAVLHRHGLKAILGTPTAIPPVWMKLKYPEIMQQEPSGRRTQWGVRKHQCFTSGAYRLLSERVTTAMAEHFRATPNVVGWQTDNEFGTNSCVCGSCQADFRQWARAKHGTLDVLNDAWGTRFWGHLYRSWEEISFPDGHASHNPGHLLDWQRWTSDVQVRFQADQIRILKRTCPSHFVTHNLMGLFQDVNYWELAKDLDFVSWDNYPGSWEQPCVTWHSSLAADLMRGLKRKNFWIMEQTAGPAGWGEFGRNVRPGELGKIAWHQVAHGADATIWFRWRTCTVGREQYWHGLLGHDGEPRRRYREAKDYAAAIKRVETAIEGTTTPARVALVWDYDSLWAVRCQKSFPQADYTANALRWYSSFRALGHDVDVVRSGADLTGYAVVIAPMLHVLPDAVARQLDAFVRAGGCLVADARTGVKDEHDRCHERCLPGLLAPAFGIRIEEYESIVANATYAVAGEAMAGMTWTAQHYADWIIPDGAEVLARYQPWHVRDYAAATRHHHEAGWAWYLGTVPKEDAVHAAIAADVANKAGLTARVVPPAGVEVSTRSGQGRELVFLINHGEEPAEVAVTAGKTELLSGTTTGQTVRLDRFGVAILRW